MCFNKQAQVARVHRGLTFGKEGVANESVVVRVVELNYEVLVAVVEKLSAVT